MAVGQGRSHGPRATEGEARPPGPERAAGLDEDEVFALGGWIARQRELRGIRLEELAALTRLPVRSLERLEAGVFDGQQDGFVRGFVRTVAIAIGLDPEDAVARLLAEPDARPRRRLPDPRRIAVAAIGVAGVLALGMALFELIRAPAETPDAGAVAAPMRRDAVRALALERGLLPETPEAEGPPALLLFDPLPADAPDSSDAHEAPILEAGRAPLGSAAPPAAQAPPPH